MDSNKIYHITTEALWQSAQQLGRYENETLVSEGYIHCSTADQVAGVLERYYKGHKDLLKLTINKSKLIPPLVFELAGSINELFPHIHGPINLEAIENVEKM